MLQNVTWLAIVAVHIAENEPSKVWAMKAQVKGHTFLKILPVPLIHSPEHPRPDRLEAHLRHLRRLPAARVAGDAGHAVRGDVRLS